MPAPRVHIVCQNYRQDRIIPRMMRAVADSLGWTVDGRAPASTRVGRTAGEETPASRSAGVAVDVVYLAAYFEANRVKPWPSIPVVAYFTHKEEQPPGNAKAKLFDGVAAKVQLRVATCQLYADLLSKRGPTLLASAPVDQALFTIAKRAKHSRPVVGLSGYTYANHRKGEDLVRGMLRSKVGQRVEWRASGRGWPVPTVRYAWEDMASFYQGLDVLVCPSRVEGIPMPPLEALACGVRVVIPRSVGMLDDLRQVEGVHRYDRGDAKGLIEALEGAAFPEYEADREELRGVVAPYSLEAWCEDHRRGFAETFG